MAGNTGYKNNWAKEKLDRISLTVPKGRKEELQEHAQQQGESLNAFINRAIDETRERDQTIDQLKKEAEEKGISLETLQEDKRYKVAVRLVKARNPKLSQIIFLPPPSDLL